MAFGVRIFSAAIVGGLCGAAFAFTTSHRLAFLRQGRVSLRKLSLYLAYTLAVILVSSYAIEWTAHGLQGLAPAYGVSLAPTAWAFLAKCLVTPLTLALNFGVARMMLVQRAPSGGEP